MAVFERLGILLDAGLLDIALVSTVYGDRFEKLVRRKVVVSVLDSKPGDWLYFLYLWRRLEAPGPCVRELPASLREHGLERRPRWWIPVALRPGSRG